ncbi:hypothetical protein GYMLUDRAFT_248469 [Collybiopsis luxurians FD-317 M1]|uniref:Uncharacterized protein n=1 Tax=Collybiopsis luxurians FD-317 M1 TaxID=944289 RepID=A0A0D0BLK1_9AGAR|nr:hypothetical protein GYMLUDRAFT_248469 [Collybiopsis luxurians FD-317 M1]
MLLLNDARRYPVVTLAGVEASTYLQITSSDELYDSMALLTTVSFTELISAVNNLDDRINGENSVIKRLLPESDEHKIAVISSKLDSMTEILESFRYLIMRCGSDEHRAWLSSVNEIRRTHILRLKTLASETDKWPIIFRLVSDEIGRNLDSLCAVVTRDQAFFLKTVRSIRSEILDTGI